MRPERQRELLRRFFLMREQHTTMLAPEPYRQRASVYTDNDRLAEEQQVLFRGQPLCVGLSADLPGTGHDVATEVAGVPLLLVRGEDAEVRGFLNICRHRGGRVASGRGRPGARSSARTTHGRTTSTASCSGSRSRARRSTRSTAASSASSRSRRLSGSG